MIVSFIEGRVRLRHPIFKDEEVLQQITTVLHGYSGVNSLTANIRTGSVLIEYDATLISKDDLLMASQVFEEQFLSNETLLDNSNESEAFMDEEELVKQRLKGMLLQMQTALRNDSGILFITLLSSVASGFLGFKKWHTVLGTTFATLALRHFSNRRFRR